MSNMVSVIMPAYNVGQYIGKSIESVLAQTYKNIELIVVNDGSSDATGQVVEQYCRQDARVKLLTQKNQGVSGARNNGISAACGDYISFLDGDDLWDAKFLENMMQSISRSKGQVEFAYGKTLECFEDGRRELLGGDNCRDGYYEDFLAPNNELRLPMHISAICVSRKLIQDNGISFEPGLRLSEDTGFMIKLLCITKAYGVGDALTFYVRRGNSATGNSEWKPDFWSGHVCIYEKIEDFVRINRHQAVSAFEKARGYVAYRFVLGCLKHGYILEAAEYRQRWRDWLADFAAGDGKLKDRLKCRLILSANRQLLGFIGKF